LQPIYNAWGAYSPDPAHPELGLSAPAFFASYGFFLLAMALACTVFAVCALRTNVAFLTIFVTLVGAFCALAGAYWRAAEGDVAAAAALQKVAGAFTLVTCAAGWWAFVAVMLAAVEFPVQLPVGDLSGLLPRARSAYAEGEDV
jgi:succinate-acetate transporter protein